MMLLVAVRVWLEGDNKMRERRYMFLGFSERDGRVLASSSFQVFLVGCGMPEKEMMK